MIVLFKLNRILYISLLFLISLLLLTSTAAADFFQSGLIDYIEQGKEAEIAIFSPTKKIQIKAAKNTAVITSTGESLNLENNKKYLITPFNFQAPKEKIVSVWAVQLAANSEKERAVAFKEEILKDNSTPDMKLKILKEEALFKVLAGDFSERLEAENLKKKLEKRGYKGWVREVKSKQVKAQPENQSNSYLQKKVLNFYTARGKKLTESPVLKIRGSFEAENIHFKGEFEFNPLGSSVLFSYRTDIEELTAYLLQNYFDPSASQEALKAQAVVFRTALLYQLEVQGARLENFKSLNYGSLSPIFREAAADVKSEVLIKDNEFYYNEDFSIKKITKPKAGTNSLAKAGYSYKEIINYYYERAEITNLKDLLDREEKFTARISAGLNLKEIREKTWAGPRIITVIDYNLNKNHLRLKPALAQGVVPGREDLSDLIKSHSALAGINGGYFHYSGRPLGLLYIDGELVSEPLYKRTALLIDKDNQISFSQVNWEGELVIESFPKILKIDGINREGRAAEIVLFNYFYGARLSSLDKNHYDIVIRDKKILGVERTAGSRTAIPPDGFVLRVPVDNSALINRISDIINKKVKLNYNFKPNFTEKNIRHAVGGGPRLLKDGKIKITGQEERFQKDILNGRAPRTAVGLTADNHLLLFTIDGRQSDLSVGMTLEELARSLKKMGAVDAYNLDGGGSARMVIRGFTMSNPSEKRLISNGVIVDEKDKVKN